MNRPLRIACLGECMIEMSDLAADRREARIGVAGDTLNTAVYLARLLPAKLATVSYLTALGPDTLSETMLRFMQDEGIDTGQIARLDDKLPGLYAIELDDTGERSFRYWRSESAARSMFRPGALSLEVLQEFDLIYLSGISLAILPADHRDALLASLRGLKSNGCQIVFDSNYRPALWDSVAEARSAMSAAWQASTLAVPSLDDEIALQGPASAEEVLARIAASGATEIVLKRGAAGPLLFHGGAIRAASFDATPSVRDSTAAGDSFNAGYLAHRITGSSPERAAQAGHDLASHVIANLGAIVDLKDGFRIQSHAE